VLPPTNLQLAVVSPLLMRTPAFFAWDGSVGTCTCACACKRVGEAGDAVEDAVSPVDVLVAVGPLGTIARPLQRYLTTEQDSP
jgi:hypothetical protein